MSTSPIRPGMVPVSRRVRAYFAPMNQASSIPTLFDPGKYGLFVLDAPPAPWLDLGWIDNFQRFCGTGAEFLRSGVRAAPAAQVRGALDVQVEFDFREWGKLQMALAGGSEHMNVLATDPSAGPRPSGGVPIAAVALLPGSTASQIVVGQGAVSGFSMDDVIAVDADYQQQTGYVGTGIAAAYVQAPADVNCDPNYVRRVTFNVGRVAQVTSTTLLLAQPLVGGLPASGGGVQKVIAFVDREGGSFFQEWSALFVAEEISGGRVCFHYPRLSPTTSVRTRSPLDSSTLSKMTKVFQREDEALVEKPIAALTLHAAFQAMPHVDENDGQIAVCYRSYFPARMAAVY
jgi:hypothetical protein